jgi:hypothetical protein
MVPKGSAPALVRTTKASTESPSVAANASRDVINKDSELLEGSHSDKEGQIFGPFVQSRPRKSSVVVSTTVMRTIILKLQFDTDVLHEHRLSS